MNTVMSTVNPEAQPGQIPKRLTVWFRDNDAAAVRDVLSNIDPSVLGEFPIKEWGIDETTGMEWVSLIIENYHYCEAVRKRLRRRSKFIRVEVMSPDIIVGGNRDAPPK